MTTFSKQESIKMPVRAISTVKTPLVNNITIIAADTTLSAKPTWIDSTGVEDSSQESMSSRAISTFYPASGTTGTGVGTSGGAWTSNGTVTHPACTNSKDGQVFHTKWANVATTANQTLGILGGNLKFWRGDAAGLGGFKFFARFILDTIPASTFRLFVGLSSVTTTPVNSDTQTVEKIGIYHDTTDPLSGSGSLNMLTCNGTTGTKTALTPSTALSNGQVYDFHMYCPPNDGAILYKLILYATGEVIANDSINLTMPALTTFMTPHACMSNGTANTTVNTTAMALASLNCRATS